MSSLHKSLAVRGAIAVATVLTATLSVLGAAPASAGAADRPSYVALGDSYSAGSFVRPWEESDGCGRSVRNYPRLVAERLRLDLTDVTCGAAEVEDGILRPQPPAMLYGPPSSGPRNGWHERPAQIGEVTPDTDLVSVGIGGNSIGFGEILFKCLESGLSSLGRGAPCAKYYSRGQGKKWLDGKFRALDTQFRRMMDEIHLRAPHARVTVVGYPAIVPSNGGCTWGAWDQLGTMAPGDMPWLDRLEHDLNGVLRKQAAFHGAVFADTYATSTGHGVCARSGAKWMYGIKDDLTGTGQQTDPPSSTCRAIPGSGQACTFIHPNAAGAGHLARRVQAALRAAVGGAGGVRL